MVGQGSVTRTSRSYLPPFIALTIASILQRKGSPWRLGIQLGLLIAAQYLISQEVLVDTVLSPSLLSSASPSTSAKGPRDGSSALPPLLVAFPMCALLAYPVWMLVAGPQHEAKNGGTGGERISERPTQFLRSRALAARVVWNAGAR